ncbi:ABC transporter permease [Anaerofilum sp. BX8]|uniref:ABC transporter permease n=1 Tax=Anaerofilum hominis TaxID=2763016 RepID=A0A923L293_9FIRM|nr:ABC transporter permease [Anaerofilum hominis]MBC5582471.1 ABC transporter permease [Anaerofilum hominis]
MEKTKSRPKTGNGRSGGAKAFFSQYVGQIAFLGLLFVVLSFGTGNFLTSQNLINVMRQISTNMYVSCALTMILITGGIDLSTGSVMALSGMVAGYMSLAGLPFWLCALCGVLSGTLSGFISGFIISSTSLPPFIVTYSMQSVLRGMVFVITSANVLRLTDDAFIAFGGGSLGIVPYPVIYMIVVIVITYLIVNRTQLGRHMYATGGNVKAAQYAGIRVKWVRRFIYMASGTMAALAGLVYTSRSTSMQPALGTGMEMDAIAAVVLGGTSMGGGQGGIFGTILGVLIIGFINNGLNLLRMNSYWQYICKGIVILIAVYLDDVKNKRMLRAVGK